MKKTILFLLIVLSLVLTSCGEKVIDRDLASRDAKIKILMNRGE